MKEKRVVRIRLWLLIVMCVIQLATFALLWAVWNNWFPPADRGGAVFSLSSTEEVKDITKMFQVSLGQRPPRFRANSEYAERAMLWDGTILNVQSEKSLADVEGRTSGLVRVVDEPKQRAEAAVSFLNAAGYEAKAIHDPDPSLESGKMSFVTWRGCPWVLVLRQSFDRMGPMPPRWTE